MAPKKRGRPPKAKSPEVPAEAGDPNTLQDGQCTANAEHICKVQEALKAIEEHPILGTVSAAAPLTVAEGASREPFKAALLKAAMGCAAANPSTTANLNVYACGGNLCWQDFLWSPTPAVPINRLQINELIKYHFPPLDPPAEYPMEIVLALEMNQEADKSFGALQRISAEEPVHACLFAIRQAIEQKASDAVMQRWRKLLLTVPTVFAVVPKGEPRYWKAQQLREDILEAFATLKRSDLQKVYDVVRFKQVLETESGETLSAEKLALRYAKNVKFSALSEKLSKSFIDSALTVAKRLLNKPSIAKTLLDLDATYLKGNPLGSIWKLQALVDRAKTDENIKDAIAGLMDHFHMRFIDKTDFAMPRFKEPQRSYIEVLLMKRDLVKILMGEFLDKHNFTAATKAKFRGIFGDVHAVRKCLSPYPDDNAKVDMTWQAAFPSSAVKLFDFAEARCLLAASRYVPLALRGWLAWPPCPCPSARGAEPLSSPGYVQCSLRAALSSLSFSAQNTRCKCLNKAWALRSRSHTWVCVRFARQALCFTADFDSQLRNCIKGGKTAVDVLDYPSVKPRVDDILEDLKHEQSTTARSAEGGSEAGAAGGSAASAASNAGVGSESSAQETSAQSLPQGFDKIAADDQEAWLKHAQKVCHQYVRLIPEPRQAGQLATEVRESSLGRLLGDPMGLVLLHYDVKLSGEPVTRPDLRVAPLRDDVYKKLVRSVIEGRYQGENDVATLQTGDIALIIDGGRHGGWDAKANAGVG